MPFFYVDSKKETGMHDLTNETLITIKQAIKEFPNRPSLPTVWRWMLEGARGRILESICVGGRRFTSKEACQRFTQPDPGTPMANQNNQRKRQQIERAKKILDNLNV